MSVILWILFGIVVLIILILLSLFCKSIELLIDITFNLINYLIPWVILVVIIYSIIKGLKIYE